MSYRLAVVRSALALLIFTIAATASAEVLQQVDWDALQEQGEIPTGEVLPANDDASFARLKLEGERSGRTVTFLVIDNPPITQRYYILRGKIRYENVVGHGYLEMWNHLPGGGKYFTRTLAESGPMQKLHGTSDWRSFQLPFQLSGDVQPPHKLEVNLVLQGQGTVYLGPITLEEQRLWWSDAMGGILGAVIGIVVGCFGAVIGVLSSRGKAASFVKVSMALVVVAGAGILIAGIYALMESQPYGVYYPLLLGGGLMMVIFGGLWPVVAQRYRERELKTMEAADAV